MANLFENRYKPILRVRDTKSVSDCCDYFNQLAADRGNTLAAVVKSDAYGFGIDRLVPILTEKNFNKIFTSDLSEAEKIRGAGFKGDIFTMNGFQRNAGSAFKHLGITPILDSRSQIENYVTYARSSEKKPKAAIHFDTGMNRNGLTANDAIWFAAISDEISSLLDLQFYMTHLHSVELDRHHEQLTSLEQIAKFRDIASALPPRSTSILSTHGTLYIDPAQTIDFGSHLHRIGVGLLGDIYDQTLAHHVYARIVDVHDVQAGEGIGYDQIYTAKTDMRVAVVEIGYGDGYSRAFNVANSQINHPLRPYMMIDGQKAPVVGKISMNMTTVDVTNISDGHPKNDYAEVIGPNVDVRDLASYGKTVPEEILIALGASSFRCDDEINFIPS